MSAINLAKKLEEFSDHWSPKIVSKFNGHDVMVAKAKGEFVWHSHDNTDDFFLILKGRLRIEMDDGDPALNHAVNVAAPMALLRAALPHLPPSQSLHTVSLRKKLISYVY